MGIVVIQDRTMGMKVMVVTEGQDNGHDYHCSY